MSPTRRDFLKATTSTAAALAVGNLAANVGADARSAQAAAQTLPAPAADPAVIELANEALNAARGAGASYADVRVGRYRRQGVATRERQVLSVSDNESYGL
ncbi:MAG TPA: twin-arginine translocation signal domain-containing protein, partial [Vicinamibacterales bacterium]